MQGRLDGGRAVYDAKKSRVALRHAQRAVVRVGEGVEGRMCRAGSNSRQSVP